MTDPHELADLVRSAEKIYEDKLRQQLEAVHSDEFVAIEPISGEYFLGRTLSDAIGSARDAYPDRLSHAIRVGHQSAFGLTF